MYVKNMHNLQKHTRLYTVLSVNEYTPFEKYNFKQYLNEHKTISKMLTRLSLI